MKRARGGGWRRMFAEWWNQGECGLLDMCVADFGALKYPVSLFIRIWQL